MGLMSVFSRSKKPPAPAAETPPDAGQNAPPDQAGEGAQPSTYGSPVSVSYGQMKLHAEKPNWKFVPHRPPTEQPPEPAAERLRWRILGRSSRAIERKEGVGTVTVMPPPRKIRRSYMLCLIGIGFLALSISINIWNARSYNGDPWDMAIPASLGILCELALFYLPSHLPNVGWGYKFLIVIALAGVTAYALTNSLKMSSILAADQAQARADRQTAGVQTAAKALADARAARATSCRRKEDKSKACTAALADVEKLEKAQAKVTTEVALAARPENTDFSNLVSWLSGGNVRPGANDFSMLWLFLRTVLPQIGGLIFMVGLARR
jgi:hypothetical protein